MRIEAVVPIMGLAAVVNIGEKLDQILVRNLVSALSFCLIFDDDTIAPPP